MNIYFLDDKLDNNELMKKIDIFINKNCINQQSYRMNSIYEKFENFKFKYIVCEDDEQNIVGVMPFILYKKEYGNIIHSMPFIGYGGIGTIVNYNKAILENIIRFLYKYAENENVLLITICTPPFYDNEYKIIKETLKPEFEKKNFFQYLDLREDVFKNMKSKFRGNLRRNVKKCASYGVEIVESYSEEDLNYWYNNVYLKRLTETGCAIYPYEVFCNIIKNFSQNRVKMLYGKLENKIIAGGMYFNQGVSVDNFMRVVDAEYFYTQVGTCLDYCSILDAIDKKNCYYNWQSCDDIGSSIYKYKEDWGSKLGYHYYLTKIVGDITNLKKVPLEIIKKEYRGIYVLPYEVFENK